MLQKNKLVLALALASVFSVSAHAGLADTGEISYSYIGLGYTSDSIDNEAGNIDATGGILYASIAVTKYVFLQANVSGRETDTINDGFGDFRIDFGDAAFRVGGRIPVAKAVDLVGIGSYTTGKAAIRTLDFFDEAILDGILDVDYSGYSFMGGVRAKPASRFELGGLVGYVSSTVEGASSESDVGYRAYVRGFATKSFSFGAAIRGIGDRSGYTIDARFDF